MIKNKLFLVGYKVFFALLGFSAIVTEMVVTLERGTFNPANFFSYFTIEINTLAFITFLLSAGVLISGKARKWLDTLRSITTVYILIVGIGFAVLLAGLENVALTAVPWDNTVLHYIIPAAVLIDFLIDRPRRKISFKSGLVWVTFPLLYAAYSLVRGNLVGWYPYPFLNPSLHGIAPVAIAITGLTVLGLILVFVITWFTRLGTTKAKK